MLLSESHYLRCEPVACRNSVARGHRASISRHDRLLSQETLRSHTQRPNVAPQKDSNALIYDLCRPRGRTGKLHALGSRRRLPLSAGETRTNSGQIMPLRNERRRRLQKLCATRNDKHLLHFRLWACFAQPPNKNKLEG